MRDRVATYNTVKDGGPFADETLAGTDPARLARDLVEAGWTGVKIYPFDRYAPINGEGEDYGWLNRGPLGHYLSESDLREGIDKVRAMRDATGDRLDIMIEGHYRWDLATAIRIGRALAPFRITWMEDMTRSDNVATLRRLVTEAQVPILASERLMTRRAFRPVFEAGACHFVMIDITFGGGLTEARKITDMADAYDLPVTLHDSQGPIGALANLHLAIACPNIHSIETVRAFTHSWHREILEPPPSLSPGCFAQPCGPGLGSNLSAAFRRRPDVRARQSVI
jgi:galactonate dehydratase